MILRSATAAAAAATNVIVTATAIGIGLSFTPAKSYEGAGASKIGSVLLYITS